MSTSLQPTTRARIIPFPKAPEAKAEALTPDVETGRLADSPIPVAMPVREAKVTPLRALDEPSPVAQAVASAVERLRNSPVSNAALYLVTPEGSGELSQAPYNHHPTDIQIWLGRFKALFWAAAALGAGLALSLLK